MAIVEEPEQVDSLLPATPKQVGRGLQSADGEDRVRSMSSPDGGDAHGLARSRQATWVPFSVPRHRRLQTAAVILWSVLPLVMLALFFFCLSFPPFWPPLIIYIVWMLGFGAVSALAFSSAIRARRADRAQDHGGRASKRLRQSALFGYFAGYFPISLVKTEDLPADRKYIFGYHPHGIIGMGAIANFGSDATCFSSLFPGLRPHLLTLSTNFFVPFFRDVLLAQGICSVSAKSCSNILKQGPGSSLTIVVGGATESLSARPGTADLTLRRRLGFIKLAIREGADLVPVFSFGENDLFEQLSNKKGTKLHAVQKRFQAFFGFTLPIFHGRGIFNYSFGLMPFRHPIVSVVGRPVKVQQKDKPTLEEIQEIQEQYITELMRIWDTWKDVHAAGRKRELSIVE